MNKSVNDNTKNIKKTKKISKNNEIQNNTLNNESDEEINNKNNLKILKNNTLNNESDEEINNKNNLKISKNNLSTLTLNDVNELLNIHIEYVNKLKNFKKKQIVPLDFQTFLNVYLKISLKNI